jgi:hypothetical protein
MRHEVNNGAIEFTVCEGPESSRVLAPNPASPTGYTSLTGPFPTPQDAIAALETRGWGDRPRRYVHQDTGQVLAEYGRTREVAPEISVRITLGGYDPPNISHLPEGVALRVEVVANEETGARGEWLFTREEGAPDARCEPVGDPDPYSSGWFATPGDVLAPLKVWALDFPESARDWLVRRDPDRFRDLPFAEALALFADSLKALDGRALAQMRDNILEGWPPEDALGPDRPPATR